MLSLRNERKKQQGAINYIKDNEMVLRILIILSLICMSLTANADTSIEDRDAMIMIDSYHHGLGGKDCFDIHNNSKSSMWSTVRDSAVLDDLYKACMGGKKDLLKGQRELPRVLENVKNRNKKP